MQESTTSWDIRSLYPMGSPLAFLTISPVHASRRKNPSTHWSQPVLVRSCSHSLPKPCRPVVLRVQVLAPEQEATRPASAIRPVAARRVPSNRRCPDFKRICLVPAFASH
jgi:hypothetical protein